MWRQLSILLLSALWLQPASAQAAPTPGPEPQELMQKAAQQLLDALEADREGYREEPRRINALVDQILLPHFDTQYSAQLVLGTHWRAASAGQRQRFIEAFYHSLSTSTARRWPASPRTG